MKPVIPSKSATRGVIFANGTLLDPALSLEWVRTSDYLIAADGGARYCLGLGLVPRVIIGDFDSVEAETVEKLAAAGSQLLRYPRAKDYTDLELAIMHAKEQGCQQIIIFAAVGDRWDQTLANLLMPALDTFIDLQIRIMDGTQEVFILRPGRNQVLEASIGTTVSLVPVSGQASGVTTRGLEYPLDGETLYLGSSRGVSNVIQSLPASIEVRSGLLFCVLTHGGVPALERNE